MKPPMIESSDASEMMGCVSDSALVVLAAEAASTSPSELTVVLVSYEDSELSAMLALLRSPLGNVGINAIPLFGNSVRRGIVGDALACPRHDWA